MKIIFNGLQLNNCNSGIGKMILEIFYTIKNKVSIIVSSEVNIFDTDKEVIKIPYKNSQGFLRNFYQTFIMGRKYCQNSLLIVTDSKVPFFLPKSSRVLPIITDLALFKMPDVYKFSRVFWWKLQYRYLLKHVDRVIAVSEHTKNDINRFLNIDKEKIEVIYCAASDEIGKEINIEKLNLVREKYNLPDKYILFIGNLNPRKNLYRLYNAYRKLKYSINIQHKLVIAGAHGWKYNKFLDILKKDKDVLLTGYIDEIDKSALYTMADIFVFPSLYEGFGIPLIEAQKCGVAVVASNNSAIPEVAKDGALYFDAYDIDDIADKLKIVLQDNALREKIINNGYENVKRFSWEKSANKISNIIASYERNDY